MKDSLKIVIFSFDYSCDILVSMIFSQIMNTTIYKKSRYSKVLYKYFEPNGRMKTVAKKMGIKQQVRAFFINAQKDVLDGMNLPHLETAKTLSGEFDYIHLFITMQREQENIFPKLKAHLQTEGMLWVSWPKGGQRGTDLSLSKVIKTGYQFGLVESTCLSINAVWSAIKFTHPKKGRVYNNSHAVLTSRTTER